MPALRSPAPVKLLAAVIWSREDALQAALEAMQARWNDADHVGRDLPFDLTDYYEAEMGTRLFRRILGFSRLIPPDGLIEAKLAAIEIEEMLRGPTGRLVNIDPGYLDLHKLVLASGKGSGRMVYLGAGVHADVVCRYERGRFIPFEWTFPDFRDERYHGDLHRMRALYKESLSRG